MKTPDLPDILKDIANVADNGDVMEADFGDVDNTNISILTIPSVTSVVTYHFSSITRIPYAEIVWSWEAPVVYDEDGNPLSTSDPDVQDDITLDYATDYYTGVTFNGENAGVYTPTFGPRTCTTVVNTLGVTATLSVYAISKNGIRGSVANGSVAVIKDVLPPKAPKAPTLVSGIMQANLTWDGLDYLNQPQEIDYAFTEIVCDTNNPPTTVVGTITGAAKYTISADAVHTTLYVQLFSYDNCGNKSDGSSIVSIYIKSVLDDTDLAAQLASKPSIYKQATDPALTETIINGSWWFTDDGKLWHRESDSWVAYTYDANSSITAGTITGAQIAAETITAAKIASDAITTDKLAADSVTATKIITGAIVADKIDTGAVTASKIAANAVTATKIAADAIDGKVITGATIQTAASGARVVLDSTGLKGYNASNAVMTSVGTNGLLSATNGTFTGTVTGSTITGSIFQTGAAGRRIVIDTNGNQFFYNESEAVNGTIVGSTTNFSLTGSVSTTIESRYSHLYLQAGQGYYPSGSPISNVEIRATGVIYGHSNSYTQFNAAGDLILQSDTGVTIDSFGSGGVKITDPSTTTSASNCYLLSDGAGHRKIIRSTSMRAAKRCIETLDTTPENVLKLIPRTWYERQEIENIGLDADIVTRADCNDAGLRLIPGFIAEEVYEIDPRFCLYNEEELEGVAYDRISAALLVVIKDLEARISELENA